jgi:hypothetical protein
MIGRRDFLGLSAAALLWPSVSAAQSLEDIVAATNDGGITVSDADKALWRSLLSKTGRDAAVAQVIAHPETVNPLAFAIVAESLWDRGNRQQAAFWFYLFQARTQPWMAGGPMSSVVLADYLEALIGERQEYAALRRAYNSQLRATNTWAMSDLKALEGLARRVFSYERRIPLHPVRNTVVSEATWLAEVEHRREGNEEAFQEMISSTDPETFYAERRARGEYVGVWQDPGPPLPDDWR